jgi:hypothetical protein
MQKDLNIPTAEDWEESNRILQSVISEVNPILELPNSPEKEESLKPLRARCVNIHYWRINLLRQRYK